MKLLLSAGWNDKYPILKYYDFNSKEIVVSMDVKYRNHWLSDNRGYYGKPEILYDCISDKNVTLFRHTGQGLSDEQKIRDKSYEHKLRKHHNYLLSKQLRCGSVYEDSTRLYQNQLDDIQQKALDKMLENAKNLDPKYLEYLKTYSELLSQPVPEIRRLAIDIEVYTIKGVFPSVKEAKFPVTCIGMSSNEGFNITLTLNDEKLHKHNPKDKRSFIKYFDSEQELIEAAFKQIKLYPIIVTFNGDNFDLAYLFMRAKNLGIYDIPIQFNIDNIDKPIPDAVLIDKGIHLDLFRIFFNVSLRNYAFNAKYKQFSLDAISEALLGEGKIKFDKTLSELTQEELSYYCLNDAQLTIKLTTYANSLLFKLLILISRITKTSIEDIGRFGISNWIKQMIYFEHRKRKYLIPNREDLEVKGVASSKSIIKDKKYKGAFVMDPKQGTWFNVVVVDFASLYPSIIKTNNISYETINCNHDECKNNLIPETPHYTCTKKLGIIPLLVGVFRDLRVEYFKKLSKNKALSKEELELYDAIAQAIKVILNGTYGVLGAEAFQLFCVPVAESITAQGRHIISKTKEFAEQELGLTVLYGDTDSLFIHNPSKEQLDKIVNFTNKKYGIDLEVEKTYKYIVFSKRKKNYFGVHDNGKIETKGLVGKKSNIPKFIKHVFMDVCKTLAKANNEEELLGAKEEVKKILKESHDKLMKLDYPLDQFAYVQMINKKIEKYGKTKSVKKYTTLDNEEIEIEHKVSVPIHVKVAQRMLDAGERVEEKQFISFIKTYGNRGKWLAEAKKTDIDIGKYKETINTVFNPLMDVLNINMQHIYIGQKTLLDSIV